MKLSSNKIKIFFHQNFYKDIGKLIFSVVVVHLKFSFINQFTYKMISNLYMFSVPMENMNLYHCNSRLIIIVDFSWFILFFLEICWNSLRSNCLTCHTYNRNIFRLDWVESVFSIIYPTNPITIGIRIQLKIFLPIYNECYNWKFSWCI